MFQQKNGFRSCLVAAIFAIAALAAAPVYPAAADDATSVASHVPGTTDGVRPVHVIGREDIERSGMSTIHELLVSRSGYNNFGLYRPQLGATVVMIDGRRISGSNSTFVLQSLPVPAVERIEFISDGATALYANSPTGAINIVLRRGFEGATAWAGAERPGQRGGKIENAGALWGGKVGRGRLTIGVDGFRRAEIRSADRAYSRASWADGGSFAGTAGVNEGGNTLYFRDDGGTPGDPADDTTVARSLGACSGGGYRGPLSDPFGIPGTGCGFAYADISWETERLRRYSLFANFDHPLDKAATFYAAARFAQGETAERFAPPIGEFEFEPSSELRATLSNLQGVVTVPDKLNVAHRFVAHGNRNWYTDLLEYDVAAGLRGHLVLRPRDI